MGFTFNLGFNNEEAKHALPSNNGNYDRMFSIDKLQTRKKNQST